MVEHPSHTKDELVAKLSEIYPEITAHGLEVSPEYDHEKHAWVIKLSKGDHALTTHLEKKDADGCMEGVQCVYLGVQISQLLANLGETTS